MMSDNTELTSSNSCADIYDNPIEITIEAVKLNTAKRHVFGAEMPSALMSRWSHESFFRVSWISPSVLLFSTVFFHARVQSLRMNSFAFGGHYGSMVLCFLFQESIATTNSSQMAHFDSEFSASWEGDERSQALSMHISSIRQATNWNLDLWRNIYASPKYLRPCISGGSKSIRGTNGKL